MDPQGTGLLLLFLFVVLGFLLRSTNYNKETPAATTPLQRNTCQGTFGVLLVDNPRPGEAQQWPWWALVGACWPEMETWVCAGWVLASNGDMGVC